MEGIR